MFWHLVAVAAVVHGGQAVVDGGSSVLVERLTSRLRLQVAVLQGLHHRFSHLPLNLGKPTGRDDFREDYFIFATTKGIFTG